MSDGQGRHVDINAGRDVGREDFDLELAERLIEHPTRVADTIGRADEVNRHLDLDLLVGLDLVEIEMDHIRPAAPDCAGPRG